MVLAAGQTVPVMAVGAEPEEDTVRDEWDCPDGLTPLHGTGSPQDATPGVIPIPFPPTTRYLLTLDAVSTVISIPSNSMPFHASLMSPRFLNPGCCTKSYPHPIPPISPHCPHSTTKQLYVLGYHTRNYMYHILSHHTTLACPKMLYQELIPIPSPVLNVQK